MTSDTLHKAPPQSVAAPDTASNSGAAVTLEDVRHVADLANLQLTAAEESSLAHDLNRVLDYIAQLNEVPTEGVSPMAQASEIIGETPAPEGSELRPDRARPSIDRAAVLSSAPETDGRFFKVPKVIER